MPVARRVLGENHDVTLKMRWMYARALYKDGRHARRSPRGRDDARGHGTDSRGACSVARIPPQLELRAICDSREPSSAPARQDVSSIHGHVKATPPNSYDLGRDTRVLVFSAPVITIVEDAVLPEIRGDLIGVKACLTP